MLYGVDLLMCSKFHVTDISSFHLIEYSRSPHSSAPLKVPLNILIYRGPDHQLLYTMLGNMGFFLLMSVVLWHNTWILSSLLGMSTITSWLDFSWPINKCMRHRMSGFETVWDFNLFTLRWASHPSSSDLYEWGTKHCHLMRGSRILCPIRAVIREIAAIFLILTKEA